MQLLSKFLKILVIMQLYIIPKVFQKLYQCFELNFRIEKAQTNCYSYDFIFKLLMSCLVLKLKTLPFIFAVVLFSYFGRHKRLHRICVSSRFAEWVGWVNQLCAFVKIIHSIICLHTKDIPFIAVILRCFRKHTMKIFSYQVR